MKQIFILGLLALFTACNGSSEKSGSADTAVSSAADTPAAVADTTPRVYADTVAAAKDTSSKAVVKKAEVPAAPAKPAVTAPKTETASAKAEDIKKGEALISQADCLACHRPQEKLVGPAYADVAKKYAPTAANVNHLVDKVISGGSGAWGEVPMSPHPSLSKEDAKAMVQYILSLK